MEDFLYDFKDFISARLQTPLFKAEINSDFKKRVNKYKLYYNKLQNKLQDKDIQLLDDLLRCRYDIENFYIDISYRNGFADGIKMESSIKRH